MIRIYQIYIEQFFLIQFVLGACISELSLLFVKTDEGNQRQTKYMIIREYWGIQRESIRIAFIIGFGTTICLFFPLKLFYRLVIGLIFSFVICAILAWHYKKYTGFGFLRLWIISLGMSSLVGSTNAVFHNVIGKENTFYVISYSYFSTVCLKFVIKKYICVKKRVLFPVLLEHAGNSVELMAFLDTGNGLVEPFSKRPVSIVEADKMKQLKTDSTGLKLIPYRSMGRKKGILTAYEIDSITIRTDLRNLKVEKPVVAIGNIDFHEKNSYEMILHPMLLK